MTTDQQPITAPSSGFLLSAMRVAYVRTRIDCNHLEFVGRAFSAGLIDVVGAIALLADADLLPLIEGPSS